MMRRLILALAILLPLAPAIAKDEIHRAVIADPVADASAPAGMSAFVIPSGDGAMNAVMYTPSGRTPHPTLLLLHGFPGNEQNLDLAQAARRAGWNVLTLHYRGSWGSPGHFSFGRAAEDAHVALTFLRSPETVARYRIDPNYIAVAGHSMGGFMAADAAADDANVAGLFLIDPWDIAETAAALGRPQGLTEWNAEAAGDMPPLAGTSADALASEMKEGRDRFDLGQRLIAYGDRPMTIVGAERGGAATARRVGGDAQSVARRTQIQVWPTDHSFSDHRIALADLLVRWLNQIVPPIN
jgi:pimeloyl-ACP methyl ester carboxylesterase